jgi:hypothetical protein
MVELIGFSVEPRAKGRTKEGPKCASGSCVGRATVGSRSSMRMSPLMQMTKQIGRRAAACGVWTGGPSADRGLGRRHRRTLTIIELSGSGAEVEASRKPAPTQPYLSFTTNNV